MHKLAVIGEKVSSYSISPLIHNAWLKEYNLPYHYYAHDIKEDNLAKFVSDSRDNLQGFNVTTPFKSVILNYLDVLDKTVTKTQSVNVVKNINGKLYGFNTDMKAFVNQFDLNKKYNRIVVMGTGGVAKTILYSLIEFFQSDEIFVISRQDHHKDLNFITSKKIYFKNYKELPEILKNTDLLINTTPINAIDELINIDNLSLKTDIFDVNYVDSKFHKQASEANIKISKGFNMFIDQAKYSFFIWFNILPSSKLEYKFKIC